MAKEEKRRTRISWYWWLIHLCWSCLLCFLFFRTTQLTSKQILFSSPLVQDGLKDFNFTSATERLAHSLRVKTVSRQAGIVSHPEGFLELHNLFEKWYPLVHKHLNREIISEYSLLYTWPATNQDTKAKPILLMSHLDVVPAADVDLDQWDFEPFAGHIVDGYIYGRGSMDDKIGVLSILEAVEASLKNGFKPDRTIYLAFGHDEEVGGHLGALEIVKLLQSRGVRLEYAIDEGGVIGDGLIPGMKKPVCMIAVAEKGYVNLKLKVEGRGGHSSMPEFPETTVGILARALSNLERSPMPPQWAGFEMLMSHIAPELSFFEKLVMANIWLTRPLLYNKLTQTPSGNAALRTVTAPTMLNASEKDNVLPTLAAANVNFRIAFGDSVQSVKEHAIRAINDKRVKIEILENDSVEPSALSPIDSPAFYNLHYTIAQVFPSPDYVVTPYITLGMTDARHYQFISDNVYRFTPILMNPQDTRRFHGINERVSLADSERCVRFYYQLIQNSLLLPS